VSLAGQHETRDGQAGRGRTRTPRESGERRGEFQAAEKMVQAAALIAKEPIALQLRYLQTMREMAERA